MTGRCMPCKWYFYRYFIIIKIIIIKEIEVLLYKDRLKVYQLSFGKSKCTYTNEFENLLTNMRGLETQFLRENSKRSCSN